MSNYLKKILFTFLILAVSYMNSVSKAMDEEDHEGPTIRARKVSFVTEDQQDASSFVKQSTSHQDVRIEESQDSWMSYLSSPVKSVFYGACGVIDFAIQNPKLAIVVGITYTVQLSEAICTCVCTWGSTSSNIGRVANIRTCALMCDARHSHSYHCR